MRGKTLEKLLDELRSEARISLNPAQSKQTRDHDINLLQRTQERLWDDTDWPHLRVERTQACQAGQRLIQVPDDMSIERLEQIQFKNGDIWCRLVPGIGAAQYNAWDSERDMRSFPVERWQIREDDEIEVWPIPDQDADPTSLHGFYKFIGIRNLNPLVDDGDRADLDDRLIVLYAAAEKLAKPDPETAKLKLAMADKRYAKLRGQLQPRRVFGLFNKNPRGRRLHGPPRVSYRVIP